MQARKNLAQHNLLHHATLLNGISVPRLLLPNKEEIEKTCVTNVEFGNIYIDHDKKERVSLYYNETN